MSYAVMPDVGGDMVCAECEHEDCRYWRDLIGSACAECGEPVDAGQTYVLRGDGEAVAHFACHLEAEEVEA